jgi:hypothetical protein
MYIRKGAGMQWLLLALALSAAEPAYAQRPPPLDRQDAWSESDKKAFLRYLNSNAPAPTGQVKETPAPAYGSRYVTRKARYLTLELVSDTLFPIDDNGKVSTLPTTVGGRLLAGGHLFTWIRYYAGLEYTPLQQEKLSGGTASLSHVQVPVGLEFALIPLGTPQTRYVLLRGGLVGHYVSGGDKADFAAPLLGSSLAWTLGLGYEWQIPDSRWRLHLLAEGYKSTSRIDGVGYYGAGLTAGVARTF